VRRLRVVRPGEPLPPRPHLLRDTIIFYAFLAAIVVVVTAVTGGEVVRAAILAGFCFVVASAWSWRRVRLQERIQARGPR
jgi:hypothetical protein